MEKIIQIIPAPANFKAIFKDGKEQNNVNVLCLALMEDAEDRSRYVVPMVYCEIQGITPAEDALCYGDYATCEYWPIR